MWRLSDEYAWSPDARLSRSNFVAPGCLENMIRSSSPARSTDWFYLPNGIFFRLTIVFPDRSRTSPRKARELLDFTVEAISRIDSMCSSRVARPRSLDVTLYLWDAKKVLPAKRSREIGVENINTGVTSWSFDGSCEVLVYRREDLEKTIVHELLHCYHIGDWCNDDEIVLSLCGDRAADHGLAGRLLPAESVVDALAVYITSGIKGVPLDECIELTERLYQRIMTHFAGKRWREKSNVFCYVALKIPLLRSAQDLFVGPIDAPNKTRIRAAFAQPLPHVDPRGSSLSQSGARGSSLSQSGARGSSLRMFP
jgi:hypothetical protein